jgi:glycosyltransferase involved in cell wall biosynthesis
MKHIKSILSRLFLVLCVSMTVCDNVYAGPAKIVGLVAARNEGHIIGQCLKGLSLFTDAICVLDDASQDNTLEVIQSLKEECNIERIITKDRWYRDEPGDRNRILQAGREIGGTHFIVLDADELFTANLLEGNLLRTHILALNPGDTMLLTWIQLWRSVDQYRFDDSVWTYNNKDFIFCDDGECSYHSFFIHTWRTPRNLKGKAIFFVNMYPAYQYGVMHFQFVDWERLLIKQSWYRCLERIRTPETPAHEINARYAPSKDEHGLRMSAVPLEWFAGYSFFDRAPYEGGENWYKKQVLGWFDEYGMDYFKDIDIWDANWK